MAKRQDPVASLYADIPARSTDPRELQAEGDMTRMRLMGSQRADQGGTPANLMVTPYTYPQRVMRMWHAYGTDPLFAKLINRVIEFGSNGSQWEVPTTVDETSWLSKLMNWLDRRESKLEREEEFWNAWAGQINVGIPNVLPGLDQVTNWAVKHLLLSGMFVPHWELGEMRLGKQTYLVPKNITCYPASSITLRRKNNLFMDEEMLLSMPTGMQFMQEGFSIEAPQGGIGLTTNQKTLEPLGNGTRSGMTEAFCLKYNWSPGDLVTVRLGSQATTGQGIYPIPPFLQLLPMFEIRQKLFAADLSILDGIINFLMVYRVGDKDHPPKPPQYKPDGTIVVDGTIAQVRKLIQEGRAGPAMELFVPYYVDLEIKIPPVEALLSEAKYGPSSVEIFSAFGIFFARNAAGSRERMERTNITSFEEFLGSIRNHVRAFYQLLTRHIIALNPGKLTTQPTWSPNPLNTKTDAFIQAIHKLAQIGRVSTQTLMRAHGLDNDVELRRIARELSVDTDDMLNENVPLSYVQQSVQPDTGGDEPAGSDVVQPVPKTGPRVRKQTAIPQTKQLGRPPAEDG